MYGHNMRSNSWLYDRRIALLVERSDLLAKNPRAAVGEIEAELVSVSDEMQRRARMQAALEARLHADHA